jgi:hypothetical protein
MNAIIKKAKQAFDDYLRRHRLFIFGSVLGFGLGLNLVGSLRDIGYLMLLGWLFIILAVTLFRFRNDLK